MTERQIELVEQVARVRGNPPIPREFIVVALTRIERGEETVDRYPTGEPSLKGVYEIAIRLFAESASTQTGAN